MSIETARWYEPLAPGAETTRSIGWWGMLLGAVALLAFQGTLVAAYLYVRWGHPSWPPTGFQLPGLLPMLGALPAVVAAGTCLWALRGARGDRPGAAALALVVTAALGALGAVVRALVYAGLDYSWDEHAYASLFWVIGGYEIAILVVGVIVALTVLAQLSTGLVDAARNATVEVAALFWVFAAVTSVVSVVTLHGLAYV